MSDEYWLVSEAVPYFTRRLAHAAKPRPVNAFHGARMFQLLIAAGWEPTQTHFTEIPDRIWDNYENKVLAFTVPEITFELLPLQTRLPDKRSVPAEPEDSVVPVRFFLGGESYLVALVCHEVGARNSGKYYLDMSWDHDCEDGPYLDKDGNTYQEWNDGEDFCLGLLGSLERDKSFADFDDALREFLFDKVASHAHKAASESMYRAWGDHLLDIEREDLMEDRFRRAAEDVIYRTPGIIPDAANAAREEIETLIYENSNVRRSAEVQADLLKEFTKTVQDLVANWQPRTPAAERHFSV